MKQARACCPTCGRTLPKPAAAVAPTDTASMSDAELFAYYKRTALIGDALFYLKLEISPELRARIEALAPGKPSKADLSSIAEQWREERRALELAAGIPSIGVYVSPVVTPEAADSESAEIAS